jgi:hypothetical protein
MIGFQPTSLPYTPKPMIAFSFRKFLPTTFLHIALASVDGMLGSSGLGYRRRSERIGHSPKGRTYCPMRHNMQIGFAGFQRSLLAFNKSEG